jgi:hypothetical protein
MARRGFNAPTPRVKALGVSFLIEWPDVLKSGFRQLEVLAS